MHAHPRARARSLSLSLSWKPMVNVYDVDTGHDYMIKYAHTNLTTAYL